MFNWLKMVRLPKATYVVNRRFNENYAVTVGYFDSHRKMKKYLKAKGATIRVKRGDHVATCNECWRSNTDNTVYEVDLVFV